MGYYGTSFVITISIDEYNNLANNLNKYKLRYYCHFSGIALNNTTEHIEKP